MTDIRPFQGGDEEPVISLWRRCGLTRPWNDPSKDIVRKLGQQPELFLVAQSASSMVGTVMAGYDGHRGWMYYLAVDPDFQRRGIGRALVGAAERALRKLGCAKVNLQLRRDNLAAAGFYAAMGYEEDNVVSLGKRLERDVPEAGSAVASRP